MSILTIFAAMFLAGCAAAGTSQQQSVEEWERQTFERTPPEQVMDAAGIEPGMVIGEVGAGQGRFTLHLARRVGSEGRILANDINAEGLDRHLRRRGFDWIQASASVRRSVQPSSIRHTSLNTSTLC